MLTLILADCTMKVSPKEINSEGSDPEMVHLSLLLAQDSGLADEREINTFVHTRQNKVFRFEPFVDIPEETNTFKKMIVKLAEGKKMKGVNFSERSLEDILNDQIGHKIVMSPSGEKTDPTDLFSRGEDYIVIVGGFPSGDFVSPVYDMVDKNISVSERLMKTWTVTAEALVGYRYSSLE